MSLAGQYLALQLLIILVVLVAVAAISVAESSQAVQRTEGRRALSAAETLASNPTVRQLLPQAQPGAGAALPSVAEAVRTISGSSSVALATEEGTVVTSSDPALVGEPLPLGESRVMEGRAWTGLISAGGSTAVVAHVPVLNDDGEFVGIAVVGRDYPSVGERLVQATPNLLTYLGVASALGIAGSLLLSRRVKRQTLGMEPREITSLVEHREAMLHGLKEGVIALDPQERITLINDSARQLLELPTDCVGRDLDALGVDAQLKEALTETHSGPDRLVLVGERMVAFNRRPIRSHGRVIGSVTTLRDRTELSSLEKELGATRTTTDTLRAQTHEFANQLHTISGLIQLEEYDEVVQFVEGVSRSRTQLYDDVTTRVSDPSLAALLIAKASLAAERGVKLDLSPDSQLGRMNEELSRDLTTVVGNLVDNALDALRSIPDATVSIHLQEEADEVQVTVRDSGPGIDQDKMEDVFRQGYTTKSPSSEGGRGFGLALTRLVCQRRGGDISVHNDDGAVFTARLPKRRSRT
ncbi:sensor histidine kinase [Arthrobacter monumenti]